MVPERPEVSFFLVKTNCLFLPFVSSIFMGSWKEFPFYPMLTLPLSVSLFLVLFKSLGILLQLDNVTIGLFAFLDSLKLILWFLL